MQMIKLPFQHLGEAGKNPLNSGFNEKQYIRYQLLGEKIGVRLHCSKDGTDFEMIEKFYTRLLPVTFREWSGIQ